MPEGFPRKAAAQAGGYAVAIGIGVALVWLLRVRATERTGLRVGAGDLPRGALALLLVAPFYILVSSAAAAAEAWVTRGPNDIVKHDTLRELRDRLVVDAAAGDERVWAWVMVGAVVIGAPIVEELLYRLCVQSMFLRLTRGAWQGWAAVLLTSGVFALMHLALAPPSAVVSLFVLSVGLGIAYERTGRLGVPVVMHAGFNAVNVGLVVFALG